MKAVAKVTSHMLDDPTDIWLVEGNVYDLERVHDPEPNRYFFIDEQGDAHYIEVDNFDKYFKEVK